jgi:hypothetical protein
MLGPGLGELVLWLSLASALRARVLESPVLQIRVCRIQ